MELLSDWLVKNFRKFSRENSLKQKDLDSCVICKEETPYTFSTHIDEREHYVQGAGQLCSRCHFELYVEKPKRIPDYFCE